LGEFQSDSLALLPLWEKVARVSGSDEGLIALSVKQMSGQRQRDPSSGASRHLLPQGEKGNEKGADLAIRAFPKVLDIKSGSSRAGA
jgi:hypothetical protein